MGNLPSDGIRALRPFNICGVDFCGPFNTTCRIRGKPTYKSYVALSAALPNQVSPTCLRRWRSVSSLRHRFWQRWSREYVSILQAKNKWHQEVPNVDVGALVVFAEENLPPQQWMIGRIVAVHVGADGKVRVADVKNKDGTYRRAVHRLAVLPVAC
ncbi:hypothetical protein KR084_011487 [Drosophila pseudotakahashii]|nr:hypothetical protein KR084_011487 [Drosophila pseudotakahashii]